MTVEAGARFEGFVAGGRAVGLPAQLFVELLPAIADEAELRVTLHALFAIRGSEPRRYVRRSELAADRALARALAHCGGAEALAPTLEGAVARGGLLALALEGGDALYFVNDEAGRRQRLRVESGALAVAGARVATAIPAAAAQPAAPARVYEQEIGLLTPGVAEALAAAGERYPEEWIVEALRRAARANARSWAYTDAILRRWEREGPDLDAGAQGGSEDAADAPAGRAAARTARRDHGPYERVVRRE